MLALYMLTTRQAQWYYNITANEIFVDVTLSLRGNSTPAIVSYSCYLMLILTLNYNDYVYLDIDDYNNL